jgi:hypothetical protein
VVEATGENHGQPLSGRLALQVTGGRLAGKADREPAFRALLLVPYTRTHAVAARQTRRRFEEQSGVRRWIEIAAVKFSSNIRTIFTTEGGTLHQAVKPG